MIRLCSYVFAAVCAVHAVRAYCACVRVVFLTSERQGEKAQARSTVVRQVGDKREKRCVSRWRNVLALSLILATKKRNSFEKRELVMLE